MNYMERVGWIWAESSRMKVGWMLIDAFIRHSIRSTFVAYAMKYNQPIVVMAKGK